MTEWTVDMRGVVYGFITVEAEDEEEAKEVAMNTLELWNVTEIESCEAVRVEKFQ